MSKPAMNKSSCQASQGSNTSHGSMGISKYTKQINATTLTQVGARRNCSRSGCSAVFNRSLKVPAAGLFFFFNYKDPGFF